MPPTSPLSVRALLADHDVHPSRALGQNFLDDPNTARRIVRLAELDPGTNVLEIGPGLGALTGALADAGAHVHALELDRHLVSVLEQTVAGRDDVDVVAGDALTFDLGTLRGDGWACVSNLPYNIATPVVVRLLEAAPQVSRLLVMVQREVGERLAATPGDDAYGAVSVKVAYYAAARVVGVVPPTVFLPQPKVESVLVRLDRHPAPPVQVPETETLFRLVRAGFAHRRKMLRGALRPVLGDRTEATLVAAGIAPTERAESLGLDAWATLARETVAA
ncbi:MAG TPA: 16S rRNA (adenine(1518)-N(6)/adenine(1519)-N(6))-dimethyltransferase RsmA [Acidimicrobiia bacterium]|nr:16S rRNA (adenine(1518)-N(6)/adenine(1519)-N(6))-dimethyltransferase RsmA [Acidimicrobiia bacterium]